MNDKIDGVPRAKKLYQFAFRNLAVSKLFTNMTQELFNPFQIIYHAILINLAKHSEKEKCSKFDFVWTCSSADHIHSLAKSILN